MSDLLNSGMSTTSSKKIAPSRKYIEYAVYAVLVGLFLYGLYHWAPYITKALVNGIYLALAAVGLFVVLWIIWVLKRYVGYWSEVLVRYIWKSMIEASPIDGMRYAYSRWLRDANELDATIAELEGKEAQLKSVLEKTRTEANNFYAAAQKSKELAGQKTGDEKQDFNEVASLNAGKAKRRQEALDMLVPRLQMIQKALDFCKKLHKSWMRGLDSLKDDINVKEDTLSELKSVAGAFSTAKSIVDGNSNERATYEESVAAYSRRVSAYVGQIKRFTEQAKTWAVNQDIQTAIEADETNKLLTMYDENSFKALTDYSTLLETSPQRNAKGMAQSSNEFVKALETPQKHSDFSNLL